MLKNELNAEISEKVKIQQFQNIEGTYEFIIEDEDDTLGNIIQSYVHNHYIREKNNFKDKISCTYIGYICPHPLKSLMIIRISLENIGSPNSPKVFASFLEANCTTIIEELSKIKNDWSTFAIDNIK